MRHITFQDAFIANIQEIYHHPEYIETSRTGKMYEVLGFKYEVMTPNSFIFDKPELGRINYEYAEDFYQWMMNGSTDEDTEIFASKYKQAQMFLTKPKSEDLPDNFNIFYGPRILRQLPSIIAELQRSPDTRRAVISILQESDLQLLDKDETLEFPCCDSAMFTIRNGALNLHLHMRSNNMANVLKLDMYIWGRFQCEFAEKLGVNIGRFIGTIGSAHIFEKDFDYLKSLNIIE